ncbi:MAG TPA: urease accessory protein UreD [Myxococcaceae bacterium]|jgi:urease accessory protein|nr:urease accessory protein UreD [Myxococcaceae bacterium]
MARGHLAFRQAGTGTAVETAYAESPLRFLTPRNHGTAAWAYVSTLGGGLVDGDRLALEISVGAGARVFVASQGPTRVFRSARGAASETVARVDEGGLLVLAPDPTACFAGARYTQSTQVNLAPDASLVLFEVLSAGRERWGFTRCQSTLRVLPYLDERWLLDPEHGPLEERMGRFGAIGTLLLAGPLSSGMAETIRERVDAAPAPRNAPLVESASSLRDGALVVRLAAASVQQLVQRLRHHLATLPSLLGDDPWRLDASVAA